VKRPHETPLPKLFRGEARWVWEKRFTDKGWPLSLSFLLSGFLVGEWPVPPCPPELLEAAKADED
jgi:hypothetical protein